MQIYFMLVSSYISTHTLCGSLLFYMLSYTHIADNCFLKINFYVMCVPVTLLLIITHIHYL